MQYLLTFPSIHHIDLPVVKESKFAFPDPCNLDENPVSLGILTEHEAKQNWTFPLAEFTRSMMIPGVPGMGKTNFILNLLSEIKKYQVPYFIFDVKYDYVPLFDESTLWLKPGCNFFLNMFDIKDQKPEAHASFLNGLIKALFPPEDFSPIVANLLLKALLNTCRDETKRSVKGFWKAVDEEVENVPRRNQDEVKAALHVRLTPFFEGAIGEVIKDSPIDIYQLFEQKVILDLNYFESKLGASYQDKHFLAKLILGYLMNKNASRAHVMQGGRLLHLCIIDDASSYFEKDDKGKNPFLTHIIQLCRKMGEGMIISDQTSDNLDENVVGFVNNIVAFRHPDKNQTTRNALGLPLNPNYLAELKKFSAWVRTNQSSEPFKIETLEYAPRKIYTFEEIDQFTNQNLGKLFPKFQQVQNNGFETSYNSECRIVEKNLIMNQAIRFPHKENSEKHRSNQNINELYEIVADKEKIIRLLAENIDIAGFLTVRQIQTIFMTMQDPNLVAFRNSISRVRGFLKVLVQVRPKLFSKKKMSIDGTLITVLIYSKYSHIYDLCNFHQNSETGGNITSIQINREIFLEAINEPIIVKEIR